MFMLGTGDHLTGLDSFKGYSVLLLPPITEVDDDVRHLLNILSKLHLLIL